MPTENEEIYYISKTLDEHQANIAELFRVHHSCSKEVGIEIAKLKIKAGVWGAIGGCIPIVAAILFILLRGRI